ncbi:DUF1877 family protein [Streptomyces indicus]|uniref:DUF1877 family protein n=1 Tax=Streptomyces indicus TaxID=417292 RepID=A0A1G8VWP5_9ACTN|nr:DUF1877 family protein [Streptomyces indicus]SDJ70472.1 protein of unknown function [Streptomyces indicus]
MSIHLHFRAVAKSEVRDDHGWLAEFMGRAWGAHAAEVEAGIATSVEKVWEFVDRLYAAAARPGAHAEGGQPWALPVYGGRPVPHRPGADPSDPPLMLLEPPGVSQAADFLGQVSFDALWTAARAELGSGFGGAEPARNFLLAQHRNLTAFYARAAVSGHAVVKCVWA